MKLAARLTLILLLTVFTAAGQQEDQEQGQAPEELKENRVVYPAEGFRVGDVDIDFQEAIIIWKAQPVVSDAPGKFRATGPVENCWISLKDRTMRVGAEKRLFSEEGTA